MMAIGTSCFFLILRHDDPERPQAWSPDESDLTAASCIDLPSAIGSENGMPELDDVRASRDQGLYDLLGGSRSGSPPMT